MAFVLNADIRVRKVSGAAQAAAKLRSQLQNVNTTVNVKMSQQGAKNLKTANKDLNKTKKSAKEASNAINDFGEQMGYAAKRFFAFSVATTGLLKFLGSIKEGTKEAIAFERELVKIAQVTGRTMGGLQGLTSEIRRLSTNLGVSSTELLKASRVLAQAGLNADDVTTSLQALAKSDLAPTFDNINDTTEASIALFRQFGKEAKDLEGILGSINAVAGRFAVESADISAAVRRTGGAFAAAGGNINELIALFTSVRSTTRESAESIATGFRTIFTRLQRVRTRKFLENLGIDLADAENLFVGPYEAIRRLSEALQNLPSTDPRFAQIIEELGGFRQVSKVIPLIQQFGTAQKALNVAMSGTDSLSKDAEVAQRSLAVQIEKTRQRFVAMIREFANTGTFRKITQLVLNLSNAFIKMAETLKPLAPLLSVMAGVGIGKMVPQLIRGAKQVPGLGFNQGGYVPGVGNTDTVPAKLTPGEFVLRKSAVQSIGKDNLEGLNKGGLKRYQDGGYTYDDDELIDQVSQPGKAQQTKLSKNKLSGRSNKTYGVAIADFRNNTKNSKANVTNSNPEVSLALIQSKFKKDPEISSSLKEQYNVGYNGSADPNSFSAQNVAIGYIKKEASEVLRQTGKKRISRVMDSMSKKLIPEADIIKGATVPNVDGILGGIFEGVIARLGSPYSQEKVKDSDDRRTWDFPIGIQGQSQKLFDNKAITKNIPVDAKKSSAAAFDKNSIRNKIGNTIIDKITSSPGSEYDGFKLTQIATPRVKSEIKPRADGGMINEPNSILTPGERVFSTSEVNNIGVNNLEYMNRTGKLPGMAVGGSFKPGFNPKLRKRGTSHGNVGFTKQYRQQRLEFLEEKAKRGTIMPSEFNELLKLRQWMKRTNLSRSRRFPGYMDKSVNKPWLLRPHERNHLGIKEGPGFNKGGLVRMRRGGKIKSYNKGGRVGGLKRYTYASGGKVDGLKRYASGGLKTYQTGGGVLGGGISGAAGFGIALGSVGLLSESFKGVSETADKITDSLVRFGTQLGILFMAFKTAGNTIGKFDQKIQQSQEKIEKYGELEQKQGERQLQEQSKFNALKEKRDALAPGSQKRKAVTQEVKETRLSRNAIRRQIRSTHNSINTQEKLVESQQAMQTNVVRASMVLAGLSAAASAAASILERIGKSDIEAGGTGESLKWSRALGTGSITSNLTAMVGAAIGTAIGGPGAGTIAGGAIGGTVGGIGGGIFGYGSGSKEAFSLIEMRDFEKSLKRVSGRFEDVSKGFTTFEDQAPSIRGFVSGTRATLSQRDITAEGRQNILAGAKQNLEGFNSYLSKAAESAAESADENDRFAQFMAIAGEDVFRFTAELQGIPYGRLREQIERQIDARRKGIEFQKQANKTLDAYAERIRNITNLSRAFESISLTMQRFGSDVENILSFAGGGAGSFKVLDESARLGSPEKFFDPQRFAEVLNRDIRRNPFIQDKFPGATDTAGVSFAGDVQAAGDAISDLPAILLKLRNSIGSFTKEEAVDKLLAEFDEAPDFVLNALRKSANEIIGGEGQEEKFIEALQTDPHGTAKKLGDAFKPTLEAAALISQKMGEEANRRIEFTDKIIGLMEREVSLRNRGLDILRTGEELRAQAGNRQTNLPLMQRLDDQRFRGDSRDPDVLGSRLSEAQRRLTALNNQMGSSGPKVRGELTDAMKEQKEIISKTNRELEFLADISSRASVTMEGISRIDTEQKFIREQVNRGVFAEDPQTKRDLALSLRATRFAAGQRNLNNIPMNLRGDVLSMLQSLPDQMSKRMFGATGSDILTDIRYNELVGEGMDPDFARQLAQGLTDANKSELERLQQSLTNIINTARDANNKLIDNLGSQQDQLISKLDSSIIKFANKMQSIIDQQKIQQLEKDVSGKEGDLTKLLSQRSNLLKFDQRFSGGMDRATVVGENLSRIRQYGEQSQLEEGVNKFLDYASVLKQNVGEYGGGFSDTIMNSILKNTGLDVRGVGSIDQTAAESMIEQQRSRIKDISGSTDIANAFEQAMNKNGLFSEEGVVTYVDFLRAINKAAQEAVSVAKLSVQDLPDLTEGLTDVGLLGDEALASGWALSQKEISGITNNYKVVKAEWDSFKDNTDLSGLTAQINKLRDVLNIKSQEILGIKFPNIKNIIDNSTEDILPPPIPYRRQRGGFIGFNKGGVVPGVGNRDTVPAMLTPGETVIPKMQRGGDPFEEYKRQKLEMANSPSLKPTDYDSKFDKLRSLVSSSRLKRYTNLNEDNIDKVLERERKNKERYSDRGSNVTEEMRTRGKRYRAWHDKQKEGQLSTTVISPPTQVKTGREKTKYDYLIEVEKEVADKNLGSNKRDSTKIQQIEPSTITPQDVKKTAFIPTNLTRIPGYTDSGVSRKLTFEELNFGMSREEVAKKKSLQKEKEHRDKSARQNEFGLYFKNDQEEAEYATSLRSHYGRLDSYKKELHRYQSMANQLNRYEIRSDLAAQSNLHYYKEDFELEKLSKRRKYLQKLVKNIELVQAKESSKERELESASQQRYGRGLGDTATTSEKALVALDTIRKTHYGDALSLTTSDEDLKYAYQNIGDYSTAGAITQELLSVQGVVETAAAGPLLKGAGLGAKGIGAATKIAKGSKTGTAIGTSLTIKGRIAKGMLDDTVTIGKNLVGGTSRAIGRTGPGQIVAREAGATVAGFKDLGRGIVSGGKKTIGVSKGVINAARESGLSKTAIQTFDTTVGKNSPLADAFRGANKMLAKEARLRKLPVIKTPDQGMLAVKDSFGALGETAAVYGNRLQKSPALQSAGKIYGNIKNVSKQGSEFYQSQKGKVGLKANQFLNQRDYYRTDLSRIEKLKRFFGFGSDEVVQKTNQFSKTIPSSSKQQDKATQALQRIANAKQLKKQAQASRISTLQKQTRPTSSIRNSIQNKFESAKESLKLIRTNVNKKAETKKYLSTVNRAFNDIAEIKDAKEAKKHIIRLGKELDIPEELLPINKGQISFEQRNFDRIANRIRKHLGLKSNFVVKGAANRKTGKISFPKTGASTSIIDHEVFHAMQSNLKSKYNDPIVQGKLQKLIEPIQQRIKRETKSELNTSVDEITARIFASRREMPGYFNDMRSIIGFQGGGHIAGFGSGDKVKALLEPGEYVLNRNAVSSVGKQNLDRVNNKYSRFQSGGAVGIQEGGSVNIDGSTIIEVSKQLNQVMQGFGGIANQFANTAEVLNGIEISHSIKLDHTVTFNGLSALQDLQMGMEKVAERIVVNKLNDFIDTRLGGQVEKLQ